MVRPHMIAEINAIETLLRSLGPSQAGALMPKDRLAWPRKSELKGDPFAREKSRVGYRSVAAERLSGKHRGRRVHEPRKGDRSETGEKLN